MSQVSPSAAAPWHPISPGWQRNMFGGEIALALFSTYGRAPGHGSLEIRLTYRSDAVVAPDEFARLLRSAWLDIRYNLHPLVAAVASAPADLLDAAGYTLSYPLVDAHGADQWARETVICHEAQQTMDTLAASLKDSAPTARGSRAALHWSPVPPSAQGKGSSFHLLYVSGHWVTDGIGAFKMLNRILGSLNGRAPEEMVWGHEVVRLSVPLAVATGLRQADRNGLVPLQPGAVEDFMKAAMEAEAATAPAFEGAMPHSNGQELPIFSPTTDTYLTLSTDESARLLARCRDHGVTVTALFNVLVLMAYVGMSPTGREDLQNAKTVPLPFFSVDRGDALLEKWKDSVGVHIVLAPFALPSNLVSAAIDAMGQRRLTPIWAAAEASKQQLAEAKKAEGAVKYEHELVCAQLPLLVQGPDGSTCFNGRTAFVTAIGRVSPLFPAPPTSDSPGTQWTVENPENLATVRWSRLTVAMWEWRGRTTLKLGASEQYHRQEDLERFMGMVRGYVDALLASSE